MERSVVAERQAAGLDGYEVIGRNNEGVGPVDASWVDIESGQIAFVGLKTGVFSTDAYVVPVNESEINAEDKAIHVPYGAEYIKRGPTADMQQGITDSDRTNINQYYGTAPTPGPYRSAMYENTAPEAGQAPPPPPPAPRQDLTEVGQVVVERVETVPPAPHETGASAPESFAGPSDSGTETGQTASILVPAIVGAALFLPGVLALVALTRRMAPEPEPQPWWRRALDELRDRI